MANKNNIHKKRKREQWLSMEETAKVLLSDHNLEKKKRVNKRKTVYDMLDIIQPGFLQHDKFVRNHLEWKSASYNLDRQKEDFIRWIYCLYPVPQFMFEVFNHNIKSFSPNSSNNYLNWFFAMATGGSFAKIVKGTLTKKEAHLFCTAPNKYSISENIWWVKCKALGLSDKIAHNFVKRWLPPFYTTGISKFWNSLLMILAKDKDIVNIENLSDVMDFLMAKHGNEPGYTLKGRTFNSLIKSSNKWHSDLQMKKFGDKNLRWEGIDVPDYHWHEKEKDARTGQKVKWSVFQLHTSKELYYEGRQMKHCVASYAQRCVNGSSTIFTVESDDGVNTQKHVTIEINRHKQLVQYQGKVNREPTGMANSVFKKWMNINNFKGLY